MSYLNGPRLVFAGRFQADVSTVNNTHDNFNTKLEPNQRDPAWNPRGTGVFRFVSCAVTSGTYADGSSAAGDSAIGLQIGDGGPRAPGKLVDLDTDQQGCSQIWGWRVHAGTPGEAPALAGEFEVAAFSDLWVRAAGGARGDGKFGAFWQSVLTQVVWGAALNSRLLSEIKAASAAGLLSIRFNTDGYLDNEEANDPNNPRFTSGRIVGAIGPAQAGEPRSFVRGRQCFPVQGDASGNPIVGWFPATVDKRRGKIIADFGNAFRTNGVGGPPIPVAGLQLGYVDAQQKFSPLGPINVGDETWYQTTAGICEAPAGRALTAAELAALDSAPVAAATPDGAGGWTVVTQEGSDGLHVRADGFVLRMSPGDRQSFKLWASRFGEPAANAAINLAVGPVPGNPPLPPPSDAALTVAGSVTTGQDGAVEVALSATNPGNPRVFIDGQVYAVSYNLAASATAVNPYQDPFDFVSVLLWTEHKVPAAPTWWEDVYPILLQYADLYPVMKPIVDLGDYVSVVKNKRGLLTAMSLPPSDSNYMPVTRDLSPAKRETILKWLAADPPPEGVRPPQNVIASIQESGKARPFRAVSRRAS
jgi:hypothetical protein